MPDYGLILQRSWKIIKKNKWLTVYGLVIASLGTGIGSYQSLNLPSNFPGLKKLPEKIPEDISEKTSQVLGIFTNRFMKWLTSVTPITWLLLILGILAAFLLGLIIRQIALSWAKGGLISGIQLANQDQPVSLANTSPAGITAIKNLIIFGLIMLGITMAFLISISSIFLGGFLIFKNIPVFSFLFPIIGGILAFLIFIFAVMLLTMINIYAERLIVLKNYSPWQAWKKGLSLSKNNFLPTIVMGIINSFLGLSIGCLTTIVLIIILAIPTVFTLIAFGIKRENLFSLPTILGTLFIVLIFINATKLIGAIIAVFKYSNWNQLFENVIAQKEIETT